MVRGNHTHERSDITNFTHSHTEDTGWLYLTLINGWVNFDSGTTYGGAGRAAMVRRLNGIVYLQGVISGGADGTDAFVLDAGFRMAVAGVYEGDFPVQISTGIGFMLQDASTGNMRVTGGAGTTTYTYLTGINYPADS